MPSIGSESHIDKTIMNIILYRTKLCPRCFLAKKYLIELTRGRSAVQIEEREVFSSPLEVYREGIAMVPAIRIGDQVLSGIFLSRDRIRAFLQRTGCL